MDATKMLHRWVIHREASEFERSSDKLRSQRRLLLGFIRRNRKFLRTTYFDRKARMGYLKDLTNTQITRACLEILESMEADSPIWVPPSLRKFKGTEV